ncbi:MAG: aminotransferase class III-fold pyridoxal phosphate-dependent enzyme [Kouleothrix sp.]|nr:aminotransferase class III-fold pyridoxal phosphate-dependent enzyme [Kouleothrix sp.]
MTIEETYRQIHPGSAARYERAVGLFPSGVTHDGRFADPFPLFVERSQGAHKWDVDGHQLIDYWTGHGALLLGHAHPDVVAAVAGQMARGTHYGAEHDLELRWAELVQGMFPSIERLRFTASGTEATMLALRLARAYTGRPVVVRLAGHYHGWHDLLARDAAGEGSPPGVYGGLIEATIVLPADLTVLETTLAARPDIAAVILEPTGASYGAMPLQNEFMRELRRLTAARDVLLICDEVVTGFRVAPGGVQQRANIQADLTALAKILAGGLPGGAVGGRAEIMRHLAFGDADWNREHKIRHNGTFNANPLSAAAGVATLERVATGEPGARAIELCQRLIVGMNRVLRERELSGWAAYGDASIFHLLAGSSVDFAPGEPAPNVPPSELKQGGDARLLRLLRLGLNNHGVDLMRGRSGFLSAAHTEADVDATVAAFASALDDIAPRG